MTLWLALLLATAPFYPAADEQESVEGMSTIQDEAALLEAINTGWRWSGTVITAVHDVSPMGHMLLSDAEGRYYYLDADGMQLSPLGDFAAADEAMADPETQELWGGGELVRSARDKLGAPPAGHVFTLSPMHWIDGDYSAEHMIVLPLTEVAFLSGDLARQLRDLPDGARVQLKVND